MAFAEYKRIEAGQPGQDLSHGAVGHDLQNGTVTFELKPEDRLRAVAKIVGDKNAETIMKEFEKPDAPATKLPPSRRAGLTALKGDTAKNGVGGEKNLSARIDGAMSAVPASAYGKPEVATANMKAVRDTLEIPSIVIKPMSEAVARNKEADQVLDTRLGRDSEHHLADAKGIKMADPAKSSVRRTVSPGMSA